MSFDNAISGIELTLSLGSFPEVSLSQTRRRRNEAKGDLDDGIDPAEEKRQRRLKAELATQTTFALVAEVYIQKMEREEKVARHPQEGALVSRTSRWRRQPSDRFGDAP